MMLLLMMMKTQLMTACPFACRLSTRTRIVPRCAMAFHQSFYRSFTHMPLGNALPEVFCRSRLHTSAGRCNGRRSLSVTQMQCLEKLHSYTGWDIQRVEIVARLIYTKACVPELWFPWNTRASVRSLPSESYSGALVVLDLRQIKVVFISSDRVLAPLLVFGFATVGSGDSAPSLCCVTSGWPRMSFVS